MKVRLPKSWEQLNRHEKDIINRVMTEEVVKQVVHEEAELQKTWLKYACIALNKNFGFGRRRLLLFLGAWREIYRINSKLDGKKPQEDYLDAEMTRIFGPDGYPQAYIDKLEDM